MILKSIFYFNYHALRSIPFPSGYLLNANMKISINHHIPYAIVINIKRKFNMRNEEKVASLLSPETALTIQTIILNIKGVIPKINLHTPIAILPTVKCPIPNPSKNSSRNPANCDFLL